MCAVACGFWPNLCLTDEESAQATIVRGQLAYSATTAIADGMVAVGVRSGEAGTSIELFLRPRQRSVALGVSATKWG